jgi:hypothetical protein
MCVMPTYAQIEYDKLGQLHNSALNELFTNYDTKKLSMEQKMKVLKANLEKQTGVKQTATLAEVQDFQTKYLTDSITETVIRLKRDGVINDAQLPYFNSIAAIFNKADEATFLKDIDDIAISAKAGLNATDQIAVLAFCEVTKYSYDFWTRFSNDQQPYYDGGKRSINPQSELMLGCTSCKTCTHKFWNKLLIIAADSFGVVVMVVACIQSGGTACAAGVLFFTLLSTLAICGSCSCCCP